MKRESTKRSASSKKVKKSTTSNTLPQAQAQVSSTSPRSSSSVPTKEGFQLRLSCGHRLNADKRPNPRKAWPDPQMCDQCKKKNRVVELYSPRVAVAHLTAPTAPKKYIAKLKRANKA